MALPFKGSRTQRNLAESFAGESVARARYVLFAEVAQKEKYEQIAAIFLETAANEQEHAKRFYKLIKGDSTPIQIPFTVPGVPLGTTAENLRAAADGELEEHSQLYPHWAAIAEQEGFDEIAKIWHAIASVEKEHERRYRILLRQVEEGTVFKRDREVLWKCRNCGYVSKGVEAPAVCPACAHEQAFYEIKEVLE
jgi:rubrerythrin